MVYSCDVLVSTTNRISLSVVYIIFVHHVYCFLLLSCLLYNCILFLLLATRYHHVLMNIINQSISHLFRDSEISEITIVNSDSFSIQFANNVKRCSNGLMPLTTMTYIKTNTIS